jgi:hypothetical protein
MSSFAEGRWTGCTPSADATFILDSSDDFVRVTGDLAFAGSGHFEVGFANHACTSAGVPLACCERSRGGTCPTDGGVLQLVAPTVTTLTAGDLVLRDRGTLIHEGAVIATGRVASEPAYPSQANVEVTLDVGLAGVTANDFLCFLDEDPDDLGQPIEDPPHVGPGPAPPGYHKISPEKWRCYDIAVVALNRRAVTFRLTEPVPGFEATGGPGSTYPGHRRNVTAPFAAIDVAPQQMSFATRVDVRPQTLLPVDDGDADLGDMWIQFDEVADPQPGDCSGYRFKILHSEDGGADADAIYVAGPLVDETGEPCTGNMRLTHGVGRGDRAAIVRMTTIDGNGVGPSVGRAGRSAAATAAGGVSG